MKPGYIACIAIFTIFLVSFTHGAVLGPTRFTAEMLYSKEGAPAITATLTYDWNVGRQRINLTLFNGEPLSEISVFTTLRGSIQISTRAQICSSEVLPSIESEQDALFVLETAEKVETLSSCESLVLPFAPTPQKTPICEVYRQNVGGKVLDVVWDTANNVVRQVTVSERSTSKQLRKFLFITIKPSASPFDWSTFPPPSSCRGSTFCSSKTDVCTALDGSESISPNDWEDGKLYASRMLLIPGLNRASFVSFSHISTLSSTLSPISTTRDAIATFKRPSGLTNLASAISACQESLRSSDAVLKAAVLITDGLETFATRSTALEAALQLKQAGVRLIVAYLGSGRNDTLVSGLVSTPRLANTFQAKDRSVLPDLTGNAGFVGSCDPDASCPASLECNTGYRVCDVCICPPGVSGNNCSVGLSGGAIAGIVLGSLAALLLGGLIARRIMQSRANANNPAAQPLAAGNLAGAMRDNPVYQGQNPAAVNPLYQPPQ